MVYTLVLEANVARRVGSSPTLGTILIDHGINMIRKLLKPTIDWIKRDYASHPFRFCVELFAWAISVGCSVTMAITVPHPPLMVLYPIWITGCALYAWAAYTRKSFGMLANYILLTSIDMIGAIRLLFQ